MTEKYDVVETPSTWHQQHALLVNWYTTNRTHPTVSSELGKLINTQRRNHHLGRLGQRRIEQLEALPGWEWLPTHGPEIDSVGNWYRTHKKHPSLGSSDAANVRTFRMRREKGLLAPELAELLEALPGWEWVATQSPKIDEIREWYETHERHPPNDSTNGRWITKQRKKRRDGKLKPEVIQALEAITGWEWSPFNAEYQSLKDWYDHNTEGQPSVSSPLGRWVSRQRGRITKGTMTEDHRVKLEALPRWRWTA